MTQQYQWPTTVAQMKVLAAELIRAAESMGGDDEESQDIELVLAVAPAGTVQDDDDVWNGGPILTVRLEEYPEEGVYPVDPRDPTGGRVDSPTPRASAQDDAKDEPAITIAAIDEYGPQLHWNKHWVEFGVGAKFYAAPAAGDARDAARWRWIAPHLHIECGEVSEMGTKHYALVHLHEDQIDLPPSPHYPSVAAGVDAAIAASQQQEG